MTKKIVGLCGVLVALPLFACSTFSGYPDDPFDRDADLSVLVQQSATDVASYYQDKSSDQKTLRNRIVYTRLAAYDIEFHKFESEVMKETGAGNISGDLVVLILNGIGATTGGLATKAAMNAASAGIVGAKNAIDKEVFFNQTIPVLLAQMSSARANQLDVIQRGLGSGVDVYPLASALSDLDKYREAGSVPTAVSLLSANVHEADTQAKKAQDEGKALLEHKNIRANSGPERGKFSHYRGFGERGTSAPAEGRPKPDSFYRNLP